MSTPADPLVAKTVAVLQERLKDNLYSCCFYGSWVRGNAIPGKSDINLLIVLNESTPAAHASLSQVFAGESRLDPFILGRSGFERSVRAFTAKFGSIRRNYRVLHGADVLAQVQVDNIMERFLCEQSLRNLRLRMVQAFVLRSPTRTYERYLERCVAPLFVGASDALRLNGVTLPPDFAARIPLMEAEFKIEGQVLRDLLKFKSAPGKLGGDETMRWHQRLFPVVDAVVRWIEGKWNT
jgi:hypothetical protein